MQLYKPSNVGIVPNWQNGFTTVQEKLKHFYSHDIKRDGESESEECKNNIHKTAYTAPNMHIQ